MMYWVTMWGNAQSTVLPQPAIYAKNITLRYPLFIPFSGNKIRITFDNFCCKERIILDEIYASIGDELSDEAMIEGIPITNSF